MGKTVKPPKTLKALGRELWRQVQVEYGLDDAAGLALLRSACQCRDLEEQAMQQATAEGLCSVDRYGQRRAHPLLATARDARQGMLAALKALNLDLEPLRDRVGRPGGK